MLYWFIVHTDVSVDDPQSGDFPDDETAVSVGASIARRLKRDRGEDSRGWAVEIVQENRTVICIAFDTVE